MAKVLEELGLAELVTSIRGVSVVGAAAILAETGDPTRFDDAKAVVKHAGLCPRDNASGAFAGKTTISGRGRPLLRLAARPVPRSPRPCCASCGWCASTGPRGSRRWPAAPSPRR